jgi:glycosyltransferase involved in cell wall biosynthesis
VLRIGVDGFNMAMPRGTGVATYARTLTQALAGAGHQVDVLYGAPVAAGTAGLLREVQFFDALDREGGRGAPAFGSLRWWHEARLAVQAPVASIVAVTGAVEVRPFAARLPRFDRLLNVADLFGVAERYFRRWGRFLTVRLPGPVPDIMHWTYPLPLRVAGARNVYTLHDLVPLRLPYTTQDNKRMYLRLLRGCLRWGDHVCTVSESSRTDLIEVLGAPAGRVTNTYQSSQMSPAPAETATPEGLSAWLAGLFGLKRGGYLLYFGALEPKKNLGRLIEAYLSAAIEMPLVIVGGRAWKAEGELRLLQPRPGEVGKGLAQQIRQIDYVPGAWLAGLIRGARGVVFPSLYEGFGLPVLEAMQAGTPVLTSTQSSLPEVAGAAALLVDPYATDAIGAGLQRLASDDALCARLSAAGPAQAERFSMAAYRGRLEAMYQSILRQ